jgi:hypothetical protein
LAFEGIHLITADEFIRWLYAAEIGIRDRHLIALDRHRELARQFDLSTGALRNITLIHGSRLGFYPHPPDVRWNPPADEP